MKIHRLKNHNRQTLTNRTRELMYEYFMDRIYDVDGEYLCERLGITPETLKEQLDYLLREVKQ